MKKWTIRSQVPIKDLFSQIHITMGVIYKVTCRTTGTIYIGQTKHTSRYRWNQHIWEANAPSASQCRYLNNAIRKYGRDDFIVEDIHVCEDAELDDWERHYVEVYDSFANGYNLTKGGKSNQEVSEETRRRLSEALRGKPKNSVNSRKREEDKVLPKYIKHYKDTKCEGYKISDHPNIKKVDPNGSISFTRSDQTMEDKLAKAMEILNGLDDGTYEYQKRKSTPKGVQPIKNGYRVRVTGTPVRTFQSSKMTMEEKYATACAYAEQIYNGMQFND